MVHSALRNILFSALKDLKEIEPRCKVQIIERSSNNVVDSVVYQTKDLISAMEKDSGIKIKKIKVDGGMVNNNQFVQFLSNLLLCVCLRPKINETTSLGAAYLAGYQSGLIKKFTDINQKWKSEKKFVHKMNKRDIEKLYLGWKKAIKGALVVK